MDQDKLDGCKLNYMELKKCYKAMRGLPRSPTYLPYRAATRAQIDIYAGAHNRDRALYDKGVANWEAAVMTAFESVEDGAPVLFAATKTKVIEGLSTNNYKNDIGLRGEEAVYSFGEYIKKKRNLYNTELPAKLGKKWWK
jgi:hypothetical protein